MDTDFYEACRRLVKEQRQTGTFQESTIPYTTKKLIVEISTNFETLDKKSSIAVLYTVEWAIYLLSIGYTNVTLTTKEHDKYISRWADILGIKYILLDKLVEFVEKNMKFDVVVGNPPYTDGVWKEFIECFFHISTDSAIVCSVNPDSTMNHSRVGKSLQQSYLENGIQIKKNCSAYFSDINMPSISYFIFNKAITGNVKAFTPDTIDFIISTKVLSKRIEGLYISSGKTETAQLKKRHALHDTYYTGARPIIRSLTKAGLDIKYINAEDEKKLCKTFSNVSGRILVTYQFFGMNQITPVVEISDIKDYAYSINVHIIKIENNETIEGFNSVYLSKLYRFVLSQLRGSHTMVRTPYINALPKINLSRVWTNAELYAYFGLTQEEINYIEESIK